MKNKYLVLSSVAASIIAASSSAHAVSQINQVEKIDSSVSNNGQVEQISFAEWRNNEKAKKRDFTDRLIIKYKNDYLASSLMGAGKEGLESKRNNKLLELSNRIDTKLSYVKTLKSGENIVSFNKERNIKDVKKLVELLAMDPAIESVEPDYKRYFLAQNQPWGIADTQSDLLSDNDAANMTVCIIDSGYQRSNPDLNANNATGTNNSGTGNWYQAGGSHGTHVAGTIAAVNNSEGVVVLCQIPM